MSNVIQFSITGDTNAEQVAGRAKAAVGGLDKQMEGIGKRFSSGFKDIFLSFLGPMALLGTGMAFIGKMIEENAKKREDANQAAIDDTNKLMSAEDKYWANKRNNEKKGKETAEEAITQRQTTTEQFLETKAGEKIVVREMMARSSSSGETSTSLRDLARDPKVQAEVQALIAQDMKKNPAAGANLKDTTFQGPTGFSNVIGVGANPVMESMRSQLLETQRTNALLEQIVQAPASTDFTKSSSPSRAAQLLK